MTTVALITGVVRSAESSDLKTFTSQEDYVVEGSSIVLTQRVGEATIKVSAALNNSSSLTAANGAKFELAQELPEGLCIYKLASATPVSDTGSKAGIDSLNQDANVEYAYPVYAAQRH